METAETDQIRATPDIEAAYGDASSNGGERVNALSSIQDFDEDEVVIEEANPYEDLEESKDEIDIYD